MQLISHQPDAVADAAELDAIGAIAHQVLRLGPPRRAVRFHALAVHGKQWIKREQIGEIGRGLLQGQHERARILGVNAHRLFKIGFKNSTVEAFDSYRIPIAA